MVPHVQAHCADERSTSLSPLIVSLLTQLGLWLNFIAASMCFLSMHHVEVPPALLLVRACLELDVTTEEHHNWQ